MKSKGNYTIPNSGGNANPTANSGTSARSNRNEQNKLEAPARNQAELEPKKTGIVVAGVTVSLAAGFVLALATLLLMKKKQTSLMVNAKARPNSYLGYEEPVDSASRPEQIPTESPSFDNEFYTTDCVLSLSGNNVGGKVTRMGPLPPLPGEESIYAEPMIKRSVAYQGLAEKNKQQDAGTACNVQPQPECKVTEKTLNENSHDKGTDDDKGSSDQDVADNGAYDEGADDDKGGFDQDGSGNGAYDERLTTTKAALTKTEPTTALMTKELTKTKAALTKTVPTTVLITKELTMIKAALMKTVPTTASTEFARTLLPAMMMTMTTVMAIASSLSRRRTMITTML
ncbi:PREDICTED: uncharacterized skeletal organic matrix protein 3-like isoform X2 [Acropora digitifera]|uniref:uncharacterized skeletal organic matrix protein 3-like isoform X2 n=1 Tax=Acropora digitifera TaxID=70779 RepID=UPI00077ACF99|nr:PREDICTED: uncharacterized skeletal organic matrix protein 3-like isoform X2 [Acropora digitifera]